MEGHARSSATCEFLLCTLHGFHGQNFLTRCYRFSVLDAIPPLLMVSISALSEYTSSNCKRVAQLIDLNLHFLFYIDGRFITSILLQKGNVTYVSQFTCLQNVYTIHFGKFLSYFIVSNYFSFGK